MPNATTSTAVHDADNELTNWNSAMVNGACPERSRRDSNGSPSTGENHPTRVQKMDMTVSDAQFAPRMELRGGANTYNWDARNHLSSISGTYTASFTYDPFGRRLQKTISGNTTDFLYDGANPVQELSGGTVQANLLTGLAVDEYFQRADLLGTWDYLNDALGSTIALADSTGTVQTEYTYSPFGGTTTQGAASSNSYQFTGRENDADGLYYYRARYYSPMLSRFVSQDPIGFVGGVDIYAYVYDDPANLTDLLGLCGKNVGGCVAQSLEKNGVSLALDAAGVGAGFLPGGDFVVAVAQSSVALAGGINSVAHSDSSGAVLNSSSALLAMATPAAKGIAQTVAEEEGAGAAEAVLGDVAKLIPGVGSVVSGASFVRDLYHAYQDYEGCMGAR